MNSKTFRYALIGAWALLMGVLPFLVTSSLFFPYITGKNIFFRVVVEIILVLWFASCIQDKALRPTWSWLLGIFAGFIIWIGIADLVGIDPLRSFWSNFERMEGYITFLHLFALFLVTAQSLTKDLWYKLMGWSVAISGIAWLQGMVEHFKDVNFRIDGSFGNATYFAAYALIHIFFATLLAIRYKQHRYLWSALGLANFITIFYSGTRGALLGLVGGAVVATILYTMFHWNNKKVRVAALGFFGFIVLCTAILGFGKDTDFIGKSPVLSRFGQLAHYAVTFDAKGLIQDVGRSRTAIWEIAWEGAKEHPILGWGQDNFINVFSTFYTPNIFDQEQWFDRTHNVFFDWVIAAGFVGLLGYLGIFAAMIWYLWKKKDRFELYEKVLITGLCAAYFIHTFFVFDNITTYIFIMLIFAMVQHSTHSEKYEEKKKHHEVQNSNQLILGGIVVALALAYFVNAPVYATAENLINGLVYSYGDGQQTNDAMIRQSKNYFEKALNGSAFAKVEIREQLVDVSYRVRSSSAATSTKVEYINMITDQVEKNIVEHPSDARVSYFAGVYYNSLNDFDKSIGYLNKALSLSPNKQTMMFLLADVYKRAGKPDEALALLKRAFEADMKFVEPRLRYADMLLTMGKKAEAEALMKDVSSEALLDVKYVALLMSVNRYDIIAQIFEDELKHDPSNIQARVSLAAAYVEIGKREEAIAVLETISRDVPEAKAQVDHFISEIKAGRNPVQR